MFHVQIVTVIGNSLMLKRDNVLVSQQAQAKKPAMKAGHFWKVI
jgi:hypothetical protein